MTTAPLPHIDLDTARHLMLPNHYRIGDTIAAMTLRAWVDRNHGGHDWYLAHPNPHIRTLSGFVTTPDAPWQWYDASHAYTPVTGRLRSHVSILDDVNLWLWNDYFHWEGFRLDMAAPMIPMGAPRVLFAPLLEVDYAPERAMSIRFVVELCRALRDVEGFAVLMPPKINPVDRRWINGTNVETIEAGDLAALTMFIGNARVFIGGDTGTSHIAGCFPHVGQVALHDRLNTERHNEREFDHQAKAREKIRRYLVTCPDDGPHYRSTPNKRECRCLFFDHNGWDHRTLDAAVTAVHELLNAR